MANNLNTSLNRSDITAGMPYYVTPDKKGCVNGSQNCVFPNLMLPKTAWSLPAANLLQYIPQANVGSSTFSSSLTFPGQS